MGFLTEALNATAEYSKAKRDYYATVVGGDGYAAACGALEVTLAAVISDMPDDKRVDFIKSLRDIAASNRADVVARLAKQGVQS